MLKGFRDFIMRGNVIDLAVAVVIGAAFTALVKAIVDGLVTPVVNKIIGGTGDAVGVVSAGGIDFNVGLVITATITFLVTAAVVYFIFVAPMNRFKEARAARLGAAEEDVPDDIALLREIRDLLSRGSGSAKP